MGFRYHKKNKWNNGELRFWFSPFLFFLKKKKSLTGKHVVFSCLPQKTKMVFFGLLRKSQKAFPSILGKHKKCFPEDGGKEKEWQIAMQSTYIDNKSIIFFPQEISRSGVQVSLAALFDSLRSSLNLTKKRGRNEEGNMQKMWC